MIIYMHLFQWKKFYLVLIYMYLLLWCFFIVKIFYKLLKIGIQGNGWLFISIYSNKKVFYDVNVYVFILMMHFYG